MSILYGCSGDIIHNLQDDVDEKINADKVMQISYQGHDWVLYPTETDDIRIYIYHDEKLIHSGTIDADELAGENLLWTYMEEESADSSLIIGAVKKDHDPLVTVDGEPFDGNVIEVDDAYVFFALYDTVFTSTPEVILEGEER